MTVFLHGDGLVRHDVGDRLATRAVAVPGGYATQWSFSPFGPFTPTNGDGGEVYVTDGTTVRISATQDGGTPNLQGFYGAGCGGTGWVVFRNDAPTGSWASLIATLNDLPVPSACSAPNKAFTRYRLETVNQVPTVISEHYDDTTIDDSTDMERSFFEQGIGRVIWEAWSIHPPTQTDLATRCPLTPFSTAPAPEWQLVDCRVSLAIVPNEWPSPWAWPPSDVAWP